MRSLLLFILCFVIFSSDLSSQDWKVFKENDRIKVLTRKPKESKYDQIKIIATIQAPLSEVVKALEDVEYHKEWVYATEESRFVKKSGAYNFDYYVKMDMPFPVKDRDVVIKYKRIQNDDNSVLITAQANNLIMEPTDGLVRIENFESTYQLTPQTKGQVEVVYFMAADPGGSVPAWVVNLFTTKGPIKTMESLIELVESDHYKGVEIEDLVEE